MEFIKKSNELSPVGYFFWSNLSKDNERYDEWINFYLQEGSIILEKAYDMFDRPLQNYVAIYKKSL